MNKTILITGGAGFIGSHIADHYAGAGYNVVIVDNLSSGKTENIAGIMKLPNVTFYEIDIREKQDLEGVFEKHRPDIVNSHAAQKSVPASMDEPMYDLEVNLIGLLNLIDLSGKYGVKNFVFASTGGALSKIIEGDDSSAENDFPQFESAYAITKFTGERYLRLFAQKHGFSYAVLRYGNVYGPRQIPDGECGVIPIFVNNVLAGKTSQLMTYSDMPDGCTRDYVNVFDVVRANVLAGEGQFNDIFNISSGTEVAILDIYKQIVDVFESDAPIVVCGPRPGDIRRSVLNVSKAREALGWEPQITLKDGIVTLKEFYTQG